MHRFLGDDSYSRQVPHSPPRASHGQRHRRSFPNCWITFWSAVPISRQASSSSKSAPVCAQHSAASILARARETHCSRSARIAISKSSRPIRSSPPTEDARNLSNLEEPVIVGWAQHPGDIEAFAHRLKDEGVDIVGPKPGSRKRPDGRVLKWKTLALKDDAGRPVPVLHRMGRWHDASVHRRAARMQPGTLRGDLHGTRLGPNPPPSWPAEPRSKNHTPATLPISTPSSPVQRVAWTSPFSVYALIPSEIKVPGRCVPIVGSRLRCDIEATDSAFADSMPPSPAPGI